MMPAIDKPTINPKPPPILIPCILIYAPFLIITYKITPSNAMQRTMDPFISLRYKNAKFLCQVTLANQEKKINFFAKHKVTICNLSA